MSGQSADPPLGLIPELTLKMAGALLGLKTVKPL
jgi:hypothetical protein